ncbi:MAG: flagellar hook assembly protein FlgD [Deltaproteobacteria bacterium]|nr:MAG: flagellar hook assembly protein FlgD [Deltaproteobacteria bacterium]
MTRMGRPELNNNFSNKVTIRNKKGLADLNALAGNKSRGGIKFVNASSKTELGKDAFMKILAHQLKNQDPTSPMDQKQLTADLAQMSSLEQLTKMNAAIARLNPNSNTQNQFYAASFLGKEIFTKGTTINFEGRGVEIPISLPQYAKKVMVRVSDLRGQLVNQINMENLPQGSHLIKWDGKRLDGVPARNGIYNISVIAQDNSSKTFNGESRIKGVVTEVKFENGEAVLKIDGKTRVFLRDVESFGLPRDNRPKANQPAKKLDG